MVIASLTYELTVSCWASSTSFQPQHFDGRQQHVPLQQFKNISLTTSYFYWVQLCKNVWKRLIKLNKASSPDSDGTFASVKWGP